ncbi:MAG: bifunctional 3,4-dihydroxy-2-butanone-4-phosphate synthase/GTP cyclohydrolase II [Fimbriimonadales bacterium]|jgi:3,4-dihydroxy 2-butanone 4-phosphate synthase/GTP cyclohydrolase II|nr:bifunctional 3,4-dihydroxy-2-butanone-4-phosphate synthase/GTP cyclohydrolase II [Fimbriimonadales bacterium]GBC91010.1 Riboflavin biosynthesis protein RibBA [bacterium HR14]CUU37639.1 3,4-dihydroxy 2-butanone 4-phosphate synthase / GTP cyclohydrolase II [Armatimonadetes bacterium DC]CUU37735.1 3,4-dihydroxy 2-butanone 4-phosphate synthase / GTP cyclohydrolase II [Armatimonadetes bacterium GXS]
MNPTTGVVETVQERDPAVFATVEEAIEIIRQGGMLIVVDDEDRENEGDFLMAAEKVTPEAVNFMLLHGRGLLCLPTDGKRLDELQIPMMTKAITAQFGTPMAEAIDAREGITTGISAFDRAHTIRLFCDPNAKPEDFVRPGHVFPLRAAPGGVLKRAGHTEAAVDLARLAGLFPAGVICEILNEDGSMARMPQLIEIARKHGLKILTIADLIAYRRRTEKLIRRAAPPVYLPTRYGTFYVHAYESEVDPNPYLALTMGTVDDGEPVLVRVHSSCVTGDLLESLRCDCGSQLHLALSRIAEEGRGVLVYILQEGRGIGILNKLRAYHLQEQGLDTVEANRALGFKPDLRDYGIGAQILVDLGVRKLRLMTNNPKKIAGLEGYGLEVVEHVPLIARPNPHNIVYLRTKAEKLGHMLNLEEETAD